jgi:hypothetical protein
MVKRYDAGLLSDYGGGNVEWWQDYLRAEIERCNDHWEGDPTEDHNKVLASEIGKVTSMLVLSVALSRDDTKKVEDFIVGFLRTIAALEAKVRRLEGENEGFVQWVNDLHSGMYINCVYCGHRYGPSKDTPVSMADVLKAHVEKCPKHPMSQLKAENEILKEELRKCREQK